jgi:flagellar motor switch protein FliG
MGALTKPSEKRPENEPAKADLSRYTGAEKAAIVLMSLGEDAKKLWSVLDEEEIKEISQTMATLGVVSSAVVEAVVQEFVQRMSGAGSVMGSLDQTQRMLANILPKEKVDSLMEEISGPAGRNIWDKLANVNEAVLASYLKHEYSQTVAVILAKVRPDHSAKVLGELPEDFAADCIVRMLSMEPVQREILDKIETTLRTEFMSNLSRAAKHDSHELMAEIFNNFDRQTEARFLTALEGKSRDSAERIKALMFVFEDLAKLDSGGIQTLLRAVDKGDLALALKGASDALRTLFFSNMSERGGKILKDDMAAMGPVRLKDVDAAQTRIVAMAKDLSARGEIVLSDGKSDDELIY